jgi:hypothetical protein
MVSADLPVMRIDVIDHEGCVASQAKQEIGGQCRKFAVPMRQFVRDHGSGKRKQIAGEP